RVVRAAELGAPIADRGIGRRAPVAVVARLEDDLEVIEVGIGCAAREDGVDGEEEGGGANYAAKRRDLHAVRIFCLTADVKWGGAIAAARSESESTVARPGREAIRSAPRIVAPRLVPGDIPVAG